MTCKQCGNMQQIAAYLQPDGLSVFVMYKCQICGQGKQEDYMECLAEQTKKPPVKEANL